MEDEKRPEWKHDIGEDDFRWLANSMIESISYQWEFTGEDTSRDWIVMKPASGQDREYPTGTLDYNGYFKFGPNSTGLVSLTPRGVRAMSELNEIDRWEKANKRDRAEFERLSKKFGTLS